MRFAILQIYQGELIEGVEKQLAVYIQSARLSHSMKYFPSPPRLHARAVVDVAGCGVPGYFPSSSNQNRNWHAR
jgi:hypothetical protein